MGEITIKKLEIGTAAYWAAFNLRNEILRKPRGQNLYPPIQLHWRMIR